MLKMLLEDYFPSKTPGTQLSDRYEFLKAVKPGDILIPKLEGTGASLLRI